MSTLEIAQHTPSQLEKFLLDVNIEMDKLYQDIIHDEYTFPEYATLSKKKKKEYSLKTFSAIKRMVNHWEAEYIGDNEIEGKINAGS